MEIGKGYAHNSNNIKIQTPVEILIIHSLNPFSATATVDCDEFVNGQKTTIYNELELQHLSEHVAHEMGLIGRNVKVGYVAYIEISKDGAYRLDAQKYLEFNFKGMMATDTHTFDLYGLESQHIVDTLTKYTEMSVNQGTGSQKFKNNGSEVVLFPIKTALKDVIFTYTNGVTDSKPITQMKIEQLLVKDKLITDTDVVAYENLLSFELEGVDEIEVKTDKSGYNFLFVDNKV